MRHLVKLNERGKVTARCGAVTDVQGATIWESEVECPKCRRGVSTPPAARVMKRRSRGRG